VLHGRRRAGRDWSRPERATSSLRVSAAADSVEQGLLATGFPYDVHTSPLDNGAYVARFIKRAFGLRRAGSAALDMAYVAAGRLDGYWEFKVSPWDVAAGILLVQEAGGTSRSSMAAPWRFGRQVAHFRQQRPDSRGNAWRHSGNDDGRGIPN
jgi:fructose-1,6-bisphosphatase/inositol monophosphatase family enzyme